MGDPLPFEDEDKPKPAAPRPAIERADWLVGPEDGLAAEFARNKQRLETSTETPRLLRPEAPEVGASPGPSRPSQPVKVGDKPPTPAAQASPSGSLPLWGHGGSSVPMLRRSTPSGAIGQPPANPDTGRDFPMDDAEERQRAWEQQADELAREAEITTRPHQLVDPQEFNLTAPPLPWWAQVPQLLRFDRRVQLVLLFVALVLGAISFWPTEEKSISVAHLKEHVDRYADTQVRVRGNVSEVFPVGGSWAYTLVQGRDTIVVFTRTHRPTPREQVVVIGTLSNGYLDGQSRVAIFEATR